jgi:hypothetical protein
VDRRSPGGCRFFGGTDLCQKGDPPSRMVAVRGSRSFQSGIRRSLVEEQTTARYREDLTRARLRGSQIDTRVC